MTLENVQAVEALPQYHRHSLDMQKPKIHTYANMDERKKINMAAGEGVGGVRSSLLPGRYIGVGFLNLQKVSQEVLLGFAVRVRLVVVCTDSV